MNKVVLMGRLTKDPDVRYTQNGTAIARYILAVDRRFSKEGEQKADFIPCTTFGKGAEFAEKYLFKGIKIAICGRIQTGSYVDQEGRKVYTTDVIVDEHEFVESKKNSGESPRDTEGNVWKNQVGDGFMSIPDDVDDEGLPFS